MENQYGELSEKRYFESVHVLKCLKATASRLTGQGKKSATYFWPGSDVEYNEAEKRSPNFFYRYDRNMPFKERVRQVIEWLDRPSTERPSLITLYFEEPDSTGHKDGPSSSTVTL